LPLRKPFLKDYRELIVGMDFFTGITANFRILHRYSWAKVA